MTDCRTDTRLQTPITDLDLTKRALHACKELGIETVADALRCDFRTFSSIPNCGRRTWDRFVAEVRAFAGTDRADGGPRSHELLPESFADLELDRFLLPDAAWDALHEAGVTTVGQLLTDATEILAKAGRPGAAALRAEIARLLRTGTDRFLDDMRADGAEFGAFVDRLLSCCRSADERRLFERRIGLGRRAERRWHIAAKLNVDESELAVREEEVIDRIRDRYQSMLDRFRAEIVAELEAFDDVLTGHRPAPGTLLHSALAWSSDPGLSLRIAALLFPGDFFHHGSFLSTSSPEMLDRVVAEMRRHVKRRNLPRPVIEIRAILSEAGFPVTAELVAHLARTRLGLMIEIDPDQGEVLAVRSTSVAHRLQQLLEEQDEPMHLDEVLFAYRERYRRCHRNVLQDHLRLDGRFLEVNKNRWSLRDRHLDELEFARVEAARIAKLICEVGGRHSIDEFAEQGGYAERQSFLIADSLRRNPTVRDLGRLEFCPRHQQFSQPMNDLLRAMRRAAGEIPISRFLTNQTATRRRLVESLLRRNRLFVSPTPDRIDLLANYPFDAGRLRRAMIVTDQCLEQIGGYTTISFVRRELEDAGLGGSFLTDFLLEDILRRNGRYEFLAGGIVAQESLGLSGWIMQRVRASIRETGTLTASQLIAEHPELAEFADCLDGLMARDPLLQSHDGHEYELR